MLFRMFMALVEWPFGPTHTFLNGFIFTACAMTVIAMFLIPKKH